MPQSGFIAWHALFEQGKLEKGQTVLINGAAGGVGHLAVQLAQLHGARVIGTASARNKPYIQELGANAFIDYTAALPAEMEQSADLVLDTAGGENTGWLLDVLKPGGRLVPIAWGNYSANHAAKASVTVQDVQFPPISSSYLEKLAGMVKSGRVNVTIDSVFSLEETSRAHEKSESRRARGKIVISVPY